MPLTPQVAPVMAATGIISGVVTMSVKVKEQAKLRNILYLLGVGLAHL